MLRNIALATLLAGPALAGVIPRQNTVTVVEHTVTSFVVSTIFSYEPTTSIAFSYAPTTSDVLTQAPSSSVPPPPRNSSALNSLVSAGVNPINGMPVAPISSVPAKAAVNLSTPTKPAVTVITPYKFTTSDGTLTPIVAGAPSTFNLTYGPTSWTASTAGLSATLSHPPASSSSLSFQFFTPSTSAPKTSATPQNSSTVPTTTTKPTVYSPIPTTYCLSCSMSILPLPSNSHLAQAPPGQSASLSSSAQSAPSMSSVPSTHGPVPTPQPSSSNTAVPFSTPAAPSNPPTSSTPATPSSSSAIAPPPSATTSALSTTSATPTSLTSSTTDAYPYPIPAAPAPSSSASTSSEFAYPYPTKRAINMSLLMAAASEWATHKPTPTNALQVLQSALSSYTAMSSMSAHAPPSPPPKATPVPKPTYLTTTPPPPPVPKPTGDKTLATPVPSQTPPACSWGATRVSPSPNAKPTNIDYPKGGVGCIQPLALCYTNDIVTDQYGHCVDNNEGLMLGKL